MDLSRRESAYLKKRYPELYENARRVGWRAPAGAVAKQTPPPGNLKMPGKPVSKSDLPRGRYGRIVIMREEPKQEAEDG